MKVDQDEDREVSIQTAIEMPSDIRSIECPTHRVRIKVSNPAFCWSTGQLPASVL